MQVCLQDEIKKDGLEANSILNIIGRATIRSYYSRYTVQMIH
jgi:hypothetical protein